jgi:excisionase family DNA binding protein
MIAAPAPKRFYTIQQIADWLAVSTRTVRRWIHDGLLIAHRINGLVRISESDFAAFLAARRED